MKAALKLSAAGNPVGWVDPDEEFTPKDIRTFARQQGKPYVLAIDDADLYGSQLSSLLRETAVAPRLEMLRQTFAPAAGHK